MGRQQIAMEWAWISKNPGSREDYAILATSAGEVDVSRFVGQYVAGIPSSSTSSESPGAPPWVTFAAHGTTFDRLLVSVSVQDPWNGQDQAGRPIWPQRFFACWFDDLAEAGASYRTLWDAIKEVELPLRGQDRRPIRVAVERDSAASVLAAFGHTGVEFERLAAIAASLVYGPVAVAGTAHLRLEERLSLLDAIAGLLPYSFRAELSASSAVDNTLAHKIRLVLAEFANNQELISLTGTVPELSGPAREYRNTLMRKMHGSGLGKMVEFLWSATEVPSSDDPDEITEKLKKLDYERDILVSIDGSLEQALKLFANPPATVARLWHILEESGRADLVIIPLLDSEDPAADRALLRNWDIVAGYIVALVNRQLDDDDLRRAERILAVAGSSPAEEVADKLLRRLIIPTSGTGESGRRSMRSRVDLLLRREVPPRNRFSHTCNALRFDDVGRWQERLLLELLLDEIVTDQSLARATGWASWLCLSDFNGDWSVPSWVLALRFAITDSRDAASANVLSLITQESAWVVPLLRLAGRSERLQAVLRTPGLDLELIELAARVAAEPPQDDIRRTLTFAFEVNLWKSGVAAGTIAAIDVARVLIGLLPQNFPVEGGKQEFDPYMDGLVRVFGLQQVENLHSRIENGFLRNIVPADVAQPLSRGAVRLLECWSADGKRAPGLARYIAHDSESATITTLLRDDRLDDGFWGPLVELESSLSRFVILPLLRSAVRYTIENPAKALQRYSAKQRGVSSTRLALAMYDASLSGLSEREILDVIKSVPVRGETLVRRVQPRELDDVLREFQALLYHPPFEAEFSPALAEMREAKSEKVLTTCWTLICRGALGQEYGRRFRQMLKERLKDEEDFRRDQRRAISARRQPSIREQRQAAEQRPAAHRAALTRPSGPAIAAPPPHPSAIANVPGNAAARSAPVPRGPGAELVPYRQGAGRVPQAQSRLDGVQPAEPPQPRSRPRFRWPWRRREDETAKQAAEGSA